MPPHENFLAVPPATDPFLLLRYRDRQYSAELIAVAILELDLFTWLRDNPGVAGEQLCEHFKIAARPTDVLITLCRAAGLIEADSAGRLSLTALANEHLTSDSPRFLGPYYKPIQDAAITRNFMQVLRTGKPANWQAKSEGADWHASMQDASFARDFTNLMNCRGLSFGQILAQRLAPLLGNRRHLLDIAGGSGIYSAAIVAVNPQLNATVLEQPPVDEITQSEISRYGLEHRIDVLRGNMFESTWPHSADVHLFSNVLHDWDVQEAEQLIAKSAEMLPTGGLLIIHDAFINESKSGPLPVAEYSALLMNITQGKCYSIGEYRQMLEKHSFQVGNYQETISDRGFMTAIKR